MNTTHKPVLGLTGNDKHLSLVLKYRRVLEGTGVQL